MFLVLADQKIVFRSDSASECFKARSGSGVVCTEVCGVVYVLTPWPRVKSDVG